MAETSEPAARVDHPASWPTAGTHEFLRWLVERRRVSLSNADPGSPAVRDDEREA